MPGLTYKSKLFGLKLEKREFTVTFEKAVRRLLRGAAVRWLRAAYPKVPVWTGMARGSLKFARGDFGLLAQYLNVSVPIESEIKEVRPGKDATTGGLLARYSFSTGEGRHIYAFYIRTDVPHYLFLEFDPGPNQPGQWESFAAGNEAFMTYIRENIFRLPKLKHFISSNEVRLQGASMEAERFSDKEL